jgi:hypothetical protein
VTGSASAKKVEVAVHQPSSTPSRGRSHHERKVINDGNQVDIFSPVDAAGSAWVSDLPNVSTKASG